MRVTIHAAKTNLSKLIEAVERGEDVVIARGRTPVARLTAYRAEPFTIGILAGQVTGPTPDFTEPLDDEELALWEGGR